MTAREVTQLVALMQATYPKLEVPQVTVKAYQQLLGDLDADEAQASVIELLQSRIYPTMPTPGEIRDTLVRRRMRRARIPTPEAAWGIVQWAFRKVGAYRPFPADTAGGALLKQVVGRIGWETLCQSENIVADRAHFLRLYTDAYEAEVRRLVTDPGGPLLAPPAPMLQLAAES